MVLVDLGTLQINADGDFQYFTPIELQSEESYEYTLTTVSSVPEVIYSTFVLTYRRTTEAGVTTQALSYNRFYYSDIPITGVLALPLSSEKKVNIALGIGRFAYWDNPSKLSTVTVSISMDDDKL